MLQRVMSIFLMKSSRKWAVLQQTKIFKRALSEHKKISTILTPHHNTQSDGTTDPQLC
jgi:hypothetical protein